MEKNIPNKNKEDALSKLKGIKDITTTRKYPFLGFSPSLIDYFLLIGYDIYVNQIIHKDSNRRLLKIDGDMLVVTINNQVFRGPKEEMYDKFKDIPYFLEEYDDITKNDFIIYNMNIIDKELKSKYE